jgi:GNAT superfamily N-acetyltransferase
MPIDDNLRVRLVTSDGRSNPGIDALTAAVWPPEVLESASWRDIESATPQHRFMLFNGDGNVVAAAGVLLRQATLEGAPVHICGVCGVMTKPDMQGRGLGRIAMNAVQTFIQQQPVDFALLCEPKGAQFYEALGWRDFLGEIYMEQPTGRGLYNVLRAMTYPTRTAAPVSGALDLLGYPW